MDVEGQDLRLLHCLTKRNHYVILCSGYIRVCDRRKESYGNGTTVQKRRSTGGLFAAELICIVLMLLGGSAALAEGSLTDNYAHFVAPLDGDVLPAGEFELRWQYSDEGVTGSAGLMAERYITYLTVYRNGQEIKSDTIKLKSIDFTAPTHSWRTMLREPGDYRFILATGQGTDAPDVLSVTVTEPLREGTCGDGLT